MANESKGKKLVRRVRRGASAAGKGMKGTMLEGVAGFAVYHLDKYASENFAQYRDNKYAPALVMALGGHMLKRSAKLAPAGHVAVGLGGFLLAEALDTSSTDTGPSAETPAAPAETQGYDAGSFLLLQQAQIAEMAGHAQAASPIDALPV